MKLALHIVAFVAALACSPLARAQGAPPVALDAGALLDADLSEGSTEEAGPGSSVEGDAGDASSESSELSDDLDAEEFPESSWAPRALAPLPPVSPDPQIVSIVNEKPAVAAPQISREDRPAAVIVTLLGLLALLALAFLGSHRKVQELERKLGISQVITAGFPFVLLGVLARSARLAPFSESLLSELSPVLRIGLGSIGFVAGFRFSGQFRSAPSSEIVRVAAWATVVPFVLVAAACGAVLLALFESGDGSVFRDPVFVRDAIILGTVGAMTARSSAELFRADDVERLLARVLRLEELAGIVGLAVIASYFRTEDTAWQLPGTAWLLLTIGLGTTLGLMAYVIFERPQGGPDFVVLTLGSIGFGAGLAGYLRLSPVVVCFAAGTCLALLPSLHKDRIRAALRRVERPIYLLSLIVIGALWQVDDYRGWILVPVFTATRFLGKWLGTRGAARFAGVHMTAHERQVLAVSPMGPLAIAIVVNAQLLYPGSSSSPIVAAVIGGAIFTEVVVQLASRRGNGTSGAERVSSVALSEPPGDPP